MHLHSAPSPPALAAAAVVLAGALAAGALTGCSGPSTHDAAQPLPVVAVPVSFATTTAAPDTPPAAPLCPPLPTDCAQALRPDDPSPRNSDGTSKRLPPGPPAEPGRSVVLCYDDFGTQALAGQLLGSDWWAWEGGGSFEPGDSFDIRVVVFQGQARQEVERRYPTTPRQADYRIVARDEALRYLDEAIAEVAEMAADSGPDEFDFGPSLRRLEQTQSTILGCLP